MIYKKVIELSPNDIIYPFNEDTPHYNVKNITRSFPERIKVNPFPCMSHDKELVEKHVTFVEHQFTIPAILQWVIIPHEISTFTNAWATSCVIWGDDEIKKSAKIEAIVALSGKRTMIHPAMSRYLVGHEYGHIVDYYITECMKQDGEGSDNFRKLYSEMRGISNDDSGYGGGKWVGSVGEVIADDFRIIMCDIDNDFFVHSKAGVRHPADCPEVKNFWNEMKTKYSMQ